MNYMDKFTNKDTDGCATVIVMAIILIALAVGFSFLYAWLGMLLWNWVMPIIWAGAPVMTFWPMWGLMELCSILFKSHNFNTNTNNN